jgi:S1-C subfamily serine protease
LLWHSGRGEHLRLETLANECRDTPNPRLIDPKEKVAMNRLASLIGWSLFAAFASAQVTDPPQQTYPSKIALPQRGPNGQPANAYVSAQPGTVSEAVCRVIAGVGPGTHNAGSGTNIDKNGLVLTCAHVVGPRIGTKVTLQFPNKKTAEGRIKNIVGEVIAVSPHDDLAAVAFDNSAEGILDVRIADETPKVNDDLWTIGYPGNRGLTVRAGKCAGYLCGYSEAVRDVPVHWVAVNCWIDHGDSGGGVFTESGRLVGVQANGPGNQCYALNLNMVQSFCQRLPQRPRNPEGGCPGGQCPQQPGGMSPTPTNPKSEPAKPSPSSPPPPTATPEISAQDLAKIIAEAVRKELANLQLKPGKDGANGKDGAPGSPGPRGERGPAGKDADPDALKALQARIEAIEKALAAGGVLRVRVAPSK